MSACVPIDEPAYAYALGLYLGDGHIVVPKRGSPWLRLTLDARYDSIVAQAAEALRRSLGVEPRRLRYREGCVILQASHPDLLDAFPQHGPGKKHARPIRPLPWQRAISAVQAKAFVRGLIHSDGCRTINRFVVSLPSGRRAEYTYARYFFSNLSPDISALFREHCELLGIRNIGSSGRNMSISRRADVALLDSFIGPKS